MTATEGERREPILVEVLEVYSPTGPGGSCKGVKVKILETGRNINRIIYGPVREGDKLYLLEAERDQKLISGRR